MGAGPQDVGDQPLGVGSDPGRPLDEVRRADIGVGSVGGGHVVLARGLARLVAAGVDGDAVAAQVDLDGGGGAADLHGPRDEPVGDGVGVVVDLDVVVVADGLLRPVGVDVPLRGERLERRPVELLEPLAAALAAVPLHRPVVELAEQLGVPLVEGGEAEEGLVAEAGEDPPLGDEDSHLDLGLVLGLAGPSGNHDGAVVLGELRVGPVGIGVVPVGSADGAAELVGDPDLGHAAEELHRADVARGPVRELLRPGGLGEGVVGGAQDGQEQLRLAGLPGLRVEDVDGVAGVVQEGLVAGVVDLPHRELLPLRPLPVAVAERGVLVAVGVGLEVLQVEQLQGHLARLLALGVDPDGVRLGPERRCFPVGVQQRLQGLLAERLSILPARQPSGRGPRHHAADSPEADADALGDLPVRQVPQPLQPQDLTRLAHRQPHVRHGRLPSAGRWWTIRGPLSLRSSSADRAGEGARSRCSPWRSRCSPWRSR